MLQEEVLRVAAAYADATRAGDTGAIAALSEPDASVWHNYDDSVTSIEESLDTLRWLLGRVPDLTWTDVAVLPTPEGFVWRALITGTAPGGSLRVPTCVVATLSGEARLASIHEYLDPAGMAVLARRA